MIASLRSRSQPPQGIKQGIFVDTEGGVKIYPKGHKEHKVFLNVKTSFSCA